ncbi:hypothetical protein [Hymenobacter cellulosilyticus]|uniref:Uncharacterized protein n=1 Tax=Hymenobacter cellulosilyticus TaxID=2932248 RepID=A0A8T9QEH4_9BACT|nr:hypothetical protein [Hymenobacter cellulosilyticus]UOQ74558.1 hypothetical protein MUN79_12180 [Hymenobacter cellulosilyticus]
MLAYSTFQTLSAAEQQAYVKTWGIFMVTRPVGSFIVDLYFLEAGYYCEVWRQLPSTSVAFLRPFTEQAGLYPYLALINLPQDMLA